MPIAASPTTAPLTLHQVARQLVPRGLYRRGCKLYDTLRFAAFVCGSLGEDLECPFCKFHFRRFWPYPGAASPLFEQERIVGGGPFEHAECLWCGSFERERHAYLYLRDQTDVFSRPVRILHAAPEKRLQKMLRRAKHIDHLSVDLASPQADLKCDLTRIPLPADSFDVILCNHVLEHIPNDRAAMRELFRVLRPGGWAMLQVPIAVSRTETEEDPDVTDDEELLRRFGQRDHVRLYGLDYVDRLSATGFVVEQHNTRVKLGDDYMRRYALISDEVLFIARKPAG